MLYIFLVNFQFFGRHCQGEYWSVRGQSSCTNCQYLFWIVSYVLINISNVVLECC